MFHRWFLPFLAFNRDKRICPLTFYHSKWCCHSIRLACGDGACNGSFNWMLDYHMHYAWLLRQIISFIIAITLLQFVFIFNFWSIRFETMLSESKWKVAEDSIAKWHGKMFARNWCDRLPFTLNQLSNSINFLRISLSAAFSNFHWNFFRFFFVARIFDLVADINSGIMFSLLPANSIALGLSMYRNEHVNNFSSIFLRNA